MIVDAHKAAVFHYSSGYYCEIWIGCMFLMMGGIIPAMMTVLHVKNVFVALQHSSWFVLVPFSLLMFWGLILYGCVWFVVQLILKAVVRVSIDADGIWIETVSKRYCCGFFWGRYREH